MNTRAVPTPTPSIGSRAAVAAIGTVLLILTVVSETAGAQQSILSRFQTRTTVGAFIPTGAHGNLFDAGPAFGSQVSFKVNETFSIVGAFLRSSSEEESPTSDEVDIYQYDIGAEAGTSVMGSARWHLRPYIGVGIGGRSYNYADITGEAQHNLAGYASAGAQLQLGRAGIRLEARDYVSNFKGLSGEYESGKTRNDLMVTTGLSIGF
jgi:hypothetical protein